MNEPKRYRYRSDSPADTSRLAGLLARMAAPGAVIGLDGDLGAGKTAFSQAFARAIGVQGTVNSPTFTIIKEYEGRAMPFYHMDVYRLSPVEADELGLDDYFYGSGVTLVEWSVLIGELMPPERLQVRLNHEGGDARTIELEPHGELYANWCVTLLENGVLTL